MTASAISCLFLDVGGVLGTNGWDKGMRQEAAKKFSLDPAETDERHKLTFDTYEEGKLGLDEYLNRVVFHRPRSFSREEFKAFMFAQSKPFPDMLQWVRDLKSRYGLKTVVVSNEGRELTLHRIALFGLQSFVDCFVCSCFVHFRKPDPDMYRIALDITQVRPENVAYLDDRALYVEVARGLRIHGIHHTDIETTKAALAALGLS
jgi:putative hydrolase of the HAD superfamily